MLIAIHDVLQRHHMEYLSFHASDSPVERLWWDGKVLELILKNGEVWRHNPKLEKWECNEKIG